MVVKKKKKISTTTKIKKKMMRKMMNTKKSEDESKEYRLVTYEELPEYMKENEYIRGYYRAEWPLSNAFLSLFSLHNETINIWTHLIAFFVFLGLTFMHLGELPLAVDFFGHLPWSISSNVVDNVSCNQEPFFSVRTNQINLNTNKPSVTSPAPRWPFLIFLVGATFCLFTSSMAHLLCCHSRHLTLLLTRLDFVGITIMIITSFFPPIYYIFQCSPYIQLLYLLSISLFGAVTIYTLCSPHYSNPKFRVFRAVLFLSMGLSGIIPAVHATIVNWSEPKRNITLAYEGGMALAYIIGTGFYVSRVPEKFRPGDFDIAGCSHQIFHVFVVAGAAAHYAAGLVFLEYRDAVGCN